MLCENCNSPINEGQNFCSVCGAPVNEASEVQIPEQYKPLSPWAYFGLNLLYSIPIVGFIFLIIFSCKKSNINRRNFTRSYWCNLIIVGVIAIVFVILFVFFRFTVETLLPTH